MTDSEQAELVESQSEPSASGMQGVGWLLLAGGVIWASTQFIRGRRGFVNLLIPAGIAGAGIIVLSVLRRTRIGVAERRVIRDLGGLDPIAKAQVLKNVAQEELHL